MHLRLVGDKTGGGWWGLEARRPVVELKYSNALNPFSLCVLFVECIVQAKRYPMTIMHLHCASSQAVHDSGCVLSEDLRSCLLCSRASKLEHLSIAHRSCFVPRLS